MSATEEDDYMSDNFLVGINDVRPGLLFSKSQKRSHDLMTKKENTKRPKTKSEQERESRETGLETPISQDNKGYKLLMKMGFRPGDKIGANQTTSGGLKEPIKVVVKDTKTGLGHDAAIAEHVNTMLQKRKDEADQLYTDFRRNALQRKQERLLCRDYAKAQNVCQDLDVRHNVQCPCQTWFWPKVEKQSDDEDDDDEQEEDEELPTIETIGRNLCSIITYLRDNYNYCIYCAVGFEDSNDMVENCPGSSREDHDDE